MWEKTQNSMVTPPSLYFLLNKWLFGTIGQKQRKTFGQIISKNISVGTIVAH